MGFEEQLQLLHKVFDMNLTKEDNLSFGDFTLAETFMMLWIWDDILDYILDHFQYTITSNPYINFINWGQGTLPYFIQVI